MKLDRNKDINIFDKFLFIVIGYEHYNPLGVIRSLGEKGIYPIVIMLKNDVKIASSSRYIRKLYIVENYEQAYSILISNYSNTNKKVFIIPCDDTITSFLDLRYDELKDKFYFSNAGASGRITKYQNKAITNDIAKRNGLLIPESWVIKDKKVPHDVIYPVITKPMTSYPGWKLDYYICNDEDELRFALKKIQGREIIIQQYIFKKEEMSLAGVSINKGTDIFVSNCCKSAYILKDYYSLKMVHNNFCDEKLLNNLKNIFIEIGYEGIFSVDFLIDKDDNVYFLEINFRNSAFSYASTKLGMNLPFIWACSTLKGKFPENIKKDVPHNYVSLAEVQDFWHRVLRLREISTIKWIKEVMNADCLYDWNKHDLYPIVTEWTGNIIHFIKSRFKRN